MTTTLMSQIAAFDGNHDKGIPFPWDNPAEHLNTLKYLTSGNRQMWYSSDENLACILAGLSMDEMFKVLKGVYNAFTKLMESPCNLATDAVMQGLQSTLLRTTGPTSETGSEHGKMQRARSYARLIILTMNYHATGQVDEFAFFHEKDEANRDSFSRLEDLNLFLAFCQGKDDSELTRARSTAENKLGWWREPAMAE